MTIKDITNYLESIAPLAYQESYDNAGLIVGDAFAEISGVLVTLDSTEEVIDEAIAKGCNLVIAHHPIVFKGLKKLTGKNYVERTIIKAIKNDVAIYAIHTNLDSVVGGVNFKIAEKLRLEKVEILVPKSQVLMKLIVFVPVSNTKEVLDALHAAGAKTNDQIVSLLWTNVIGTKPTAADTQPFIAMLENGMSAGALAHLAADTSFNTMNINLVGLAQTGIEYIPVS